MLLNERDTKLLSGLKDCAVILATCWCSDVLGAASVRPKDVVDEGEESVRGQSYTLQLRQPLLALFRGEVLGDLSVLKVCGKIVVLDATIGNETGAEKVDGVGFGRTLGALLELEVKSTLVEAHPPVIGLVTGKTCAVNASYAIISRSRMRIWGYLHC